MMSMHPVDSGSTRYPKMTWVYQPFSRETVPLKSTCLGSCRVLEDKITSFTINIFCIEQW